ncbi:E3 ubiquitin-protein ligase RNF123-like [Cynoglossus semilaevis]|uniref:E3 ubiquitin-protein ligase RNF123-like n=1 Tax=Cynoglossus semilaevis TaxID=244447 RepID=UPI0007DC8B22|nr:E3 ubiquitin-protein ligase RNF123-like [Cynoglossus semilaevis]
MAELLNTDKEMAASFLNSVLNQLNWAFSEFIGMIQEIQQAAERPERNFVDARQLKVCATCFDLSVSLLRVLEMTVTLVPEIFLDWSRPSAELLLRRLAQVNNQAPPPHTSLSLFSYTVEHISQTTRPRIITSDFFSP